MKPMTQKQISYARTLATEREQSEMFEAFMEQPRSVQEGSAFIKTLFTFPPVKPAPKQSAGLDISSIPAGHYAVEDEEGVVKFLRVDAPTKGYWAGWRFVKIQASDVYYKLGNQPPKGTYRGKAPVLLEAVLLDPLAASKRYGHELGVCGVCGRTLTNPESIAEGVGPVCREKFA